jgi:CBS domain-containing protein
MRIDPREGAGDERPREAKPVSVRDRMTRPAVIVAASAPLGEALRLMAEHRIHYLPVVNEHGRLVGIVNEDDVLGTRRGPRPLGDPVTTVMSSPVVSVSPAGLLKDAMQLMAGRGIGALPIVEEGQVIGIITQSDVVAALARE